MTAAMKLKQRHHFTGKGPYSQSYCFSSSHTQVWELDIKKTEYWKLDAFELWCWRRLLESPLNSKEIKPVNSKGNQPWIFIGSTDAEVEAPILWPPDAKGWIIGKDLNAGEDWGQKETGKAGDEIVGWHHWLNGYKFLQTLEESEGQGSLKCCSSWDHKESGLQMKNKSNRNNYSLTIRMSANWWLCFSMYCLGLSNFFPRSMSLLISWQSMSAVVLETRKMKSVTASTFCPSIWNEVMGQDAMIFIFWMLSFKPAFSLSSFKRVFFLKRGYMTPRIKTDYMNKNFQILVKALGRTLDFPKDMR